MVTKSQHWPIVYFYYRPRSGEIMHLVASVRLCVCLFGFTQGTLTFKVFVCVSVISGRMRIIARMRSIGVLIYPTVGIFQRKMRRRFLGNEAMDL